MGVLTNLAAASPSYRHPQANQTSNAFKAAAAFLLSMRPYPASRREYFLKVSPILFNPRKAIIGEVGLCKARWPGCVPIDGGCGECRRENQGRL